MKKYSEKFLNQSHKLKNSTVGMEFEFYLKELSFYKTLELLNQELKPVRVHGFRQYHSDFRPDERPQEAAQDGDALDYAQFWDHWWDCGSGCGDVSG